MKLLFCLLTIVGLSSVLSLLGNTVRIVYIEPKCSADSISGKYFLADSMNLFTLVYLGFFIIPLFKYFL